MRTSILITLIIAMLATFLAAEKIALIQFVPDDQDNHDLVYMTKEITTNFREALSKKGWQVYDQKKTQNEAKNVGVDWGKSEITEEQAKKLGEKLDVEYIISGRVSPGQEEGQYKILILMTYTKMMNAFKEIETITSRDEKEIRSQVEKIDPALKDLKCNFCAEYISRGQQCYDDGNLADAEIEFKKVVDMDPNNMDAILLLGRVYYDQHKYDDAIKFYTDMLNKNPKNDNLLVALGLTYEEMKQDEKAIEMYEKAVANKTKEKNIYISLYRLYKKKNEEKKATDILDTLVKINPDDVDIWYSVGFGFFQTGKFDDAAKIFQERVLPEFTKSKPDQLWRINYMMGDCYSRTGQWSQAATCYQSALQNIKGDFPGVMDDIRYKHFRSVFSQDKTAGASLAKSYMGITKNDRYRELYKKVTESGTSDGGDAKKIFKQASDLYESAKAKALVKPFNAATVQEAIGIFQRARGLYNQIKIDAGVRNCDKMIDYCKKRLEMKR
ncbi:MAG: tetratricopeptide repeat protein [Candidatus Coatesbacteria bacterium]|nr:tetratricopeptide repeat protein [Candidatus Coatesbacteria bacterium]